MLTLETMATIKDYIDKETVYNFDDAILTHYHTNVPCIENYTFDKYLIAMMLTGNKDVAWSEERLRFQPQSIFIPPKDIKMTVEIEDASPLKPADCIVLDISNDFVFDLFVELKDKWKLEWNHIKMSGKIDRFYHFTNALDLCKSFQKFYEVQQNESSSLSFLTDLALKEIIFLLLQSSACEALLKQSEPQKNNPFFEAVAHIKNHFNKPIKIEELAKISCMSISVFYKKFKENLGCTPNDYIILERIKFAKKLIVNTDLLFTDVAIQSGFNSPEYFHRKFKALEKYTPLEYRTIHAKRIA